MKKSKGLSKRLNVIKNTMGLPPKEFFLTMAIDATEICTGLITKVYKLDDKKIIDRLKHITLVLSSINDTIEDNIDLKRELKTEADMFNEKLMSKMRVDDMTELVKLSEEFERSKSSDIDEDLNNLLNDYIDNEQDIPKS